MQEIRDEGKEGFQTGGIPKRRDLGIEGTGKEGNQERRETRKEGSEQEVCGTGKILQEGYRKGEMLDRWDHGMQDCMEGCRTRGIQERRNAGKEGCRDTGKQRCRKGGMYEPRDSRDEGCKFGSKMALLEKTTILI